MIRIHENNELLIRRNKNQADKLGAVRMSKDNVDQLLMNIYIYIYIYIYNIILIQSLE